MTPPRCAGHANLKKGPTEPFVVGAVATSDPPRCCQRNAAAR